MSDSSTRLEELLVEQTDRDLDYQETAEVRGLLRQLEEWSEDDIELAAAAAMVALTAAKKEQLTEMPASLREKISQQAQAHFLLEEDDAPLRDPLERSDTIKKSVSGSWSGEAAPPGAASRSRPVALPPEELPAPVTPPLLPSPPKEEAAPAKVISIFSRTRILLAIAASVAIIAFASYYLLRARAPDVLARDSVTLAWSAAGDPFGKNTTGGVVWSNETQTGYMRFVGLPKNDNTKLQYQLWIFDADRDERYPVDGGVFDVDADSGEVIVRIDPKIRVHKAAMFAVTVERPGGVVVSTRERLVVLAKVI